MSKVRVKVYINNRRVSPWEIRPYRGIGWDFIFNNSVPFPRLDGTEHEIRLNCMDKTEFKAKCVKCKRLNNERGYRFIFNNRLEGYIHDI